MANPFKQKLIDELHPWIANDVTKEQINAVIWAAAMSDAADRFRKVVRDEKLDQDEEMRRNNPDFEEGSRGGMYKEGGLISNLNIKYSFKELF